uniref:Uncharacterized protein n=1 Tax=viral metagenome TaxID=1070528 RepID=A0A6C0BQ31_9ZZZZ
MEGPPSLTTCLTDYNRNAALVALVEGETQAYLTAILDIVENKSRVRIPAATFDVITSCNVTGGQDLRVIDDNGAAQSLPCLADKALSVELPRSGRVYGQVYVHGYLEPRGS